MTIIIKDNQNQRRSQPKKIIPKPKTILWKIKPEIIFDNIDLCIAFSQVQAALGKSSMFLPPR